MDWGQLLALVSAPMQNGGEYSFEALQGSGAKYFAFDTMKVLMWACGCGCGCRCGCRCAGSEEQAMEGSVCRYKVLLSPQGSVEGGGCREVKVSFNPPKGETVRPCITHHTACTQW